MDAKTVPFWQLGKVLLLSLVIAVLNNIMAGKMFVCFFYQKKNNLDMYWLFAN